MRLVDDIARAIYARRMPSGPTWDEVGDGIREEYRADANAALAGIHEHRRARRAKRQPLRAVDFSQESYEAESLMSDPDYRLPDEMGERPRVKGNGYAIPEGGYRYPADPARFKPGRGDAS